MTYYTDTAPLVLRWAIRNRSSKQLLCSGHNRNADGDAPIKSAHFGTGAPLLFADRRGARATWVRWLTAKRLIRRNVTLDVGSISYEVLAAGMPHVDLVSVELVTRSLVPFILQGAGEE